jgi:hypothetical protein
MVTQADLEKRADRLRDRIQKAGEGGDRPLPPDGIRRFRKRLKHTQRKLSVRAKKAEKHAKQAKSAPAEEKPIAEKAAEEKAPQAQAAEETTQEAQAPEETATEEKAPEEGS